MTHVSLRRALVTVVTALALVATPAVPGPGAPPAVSSDRIVVTDWRPDGERAVADVEAEGLVAVAADLTDVDLEIRTHDGTRWSGWRGPHEPGEHLPDPSTSEAARAVPSMSEPLWVGDAERLQVRVPREDVGPVTLVGVRSSGDTSWTPPTGWEPGSANALSLWPAMVPRSAWDPQGECRPRSAPDVADRIERVYVHHTAMFPDHAPDEVDDALRAMCVFHVEGRQFDDLGYNFLIDRYGRIYQGRAGGILRAVVGAHASGFNHGSVGIALIGNFDDSPPPPAALDALDRLVTWLFEWHGIDPYAVTPHVSTGGATTPHPEGVSVLLPSIVAHRQTATNTSCPGDLLFEHVGGADAAVHRVAQRLRDLGVEVGEPAPPAEPRVLPAGDAGAVDPSPVVGQVIESVVAAVRTLTSRRLDERLLPAARLGR